MDPHPYDSIVAARDSRARAETLATFLRAAVVPRARATVAAILEHAGSAEWETDPAFVRAAQADDLGGGWWMCRECAESIEAQPGVLTCPSCQGCTLATGVRASFVGASFLMVPYDDGRCALKVDAGPSFLGLPRKTSTAWTSPARQGAPCAADAWALSLAQAVLNESDLRLESVDASTLFQAFPLEKDGGYRRNDELVRYIGTAPLQELEAILAMIRDRFTFLPSGDWCPDWLGNYERIVGSPLLIVEPAMNRLKALDLSKYHRWAGNLLGYVLADPDVFAHDALAMSRNLAATFVADLARSNESDFGDAALDLLLTSVQRAVTSARGVEYGVDLFGLILRILGWQLDGAQRRRVLKALELFGAFDSDGVDPLAVYVETNVVTTSGLATYALLVGRLPEAGHDRELEALKTRMLSLGAAPPHP